MFKVCVKGRRALAGIKTDITKLVHRSKMDERKQTLRADILLRMALTCVQQLCSTYLCIILFDSPGNIYAAVQHHRCLC